VGNRLPRAIQLFALVGALYALGAEVSWRWFGASDIGLAFFPAAGVSIAALVVTRRPWWPVILLAAGTAEFLVDIAHGLTPGIALGYAAANVVEPLTAATLLSITARGAVPSVDLTVRPDAVRTA
jgi:integral membrane sensor domain MASE1